MEIRQGEQDGIITIELLGRLDELATTEVEEAFTAILNDGAMRVVLDLGGVEYVSSSGLRVLLMLAKAMTNRTGLLKLCCLSPFVAEVFEISNFTQLFEVYQTSEGAVQSFPAA